MESSARFALCVSLTNISSEKDWLVCDRLAKILVKTWRPRQKRRLTMLLHSRRLYNLPQALKLISLDINEWKHLMNCLSQNVMGGGRPGNQDHEEVYAETENWMLGDMESVGFKALCLCPHD